MNLFNKKFEDKKGVIYIGEHNGIKTHIIPSNMYCVLSENYHLLPLYKRVAFNIKTFIKGIIY